MSHNNALKRAGLPGVETMTRRVLRAFDSATPSQIEAGARWYDDATELARDLTGTALTLEQAASVIAALSPRTPWTRNVQGAIAMCTKGEPSPGLLSTNVERARDALALGFDGLGDGPKVHAFAQNIAGDRDAVTIDVWAARVVGVSEKKLARKGVYAALAHAHRLAARRRGVDPATMQATTWVVARNGRSQ